MVNTYLDIRLKDDNGKKKIDKIYFCTNEGSRLVGVDALCTNAHINRPNIPQYIKFGFSNLCYNYPYRIIIADECVPPSGEYEWYNGANFNLMYAYYRLTQMLGDALPPRIDYNTHIFASQIARLVNVNGIETLLIVISDIYTSYNPDSSTIWMPTDDQKNLNLLLFPLLFTPRPCYRYRPSDSSIIESIGYYSYNPPVGLCDYVGHELSISDISWYYNGGSIKLQKNEPLSINSSEKIMRFPLYLVKSGNQIWNIDLDKLNIGYEVARYLESYEQ
jgi:hypothetical protein